MLVHAVGLTFRPSGHCSCLGRSFPTYRAAQHANARPVRCPTGRIHLITIRICARPSVSRVRECGEAQGRQNHKPSHDHKDSLFHLLAQPHPAAGVGISISAHSSDDARQSDSVSADFLSQTATTITAIGPLQRHIARSLPYLLTVGAQFGNMAVFLRQHMPGTGLSCRVRSNIVAKPAPAAVRSGAAGPTFLSPPIVSCRCRFISGI
mmetsp:Transcript_6010/g.17204  ORF Transcript_6010/g.17204 Transcript_6010/m.17204 type:complete len:208 (+) Transcript_6010:1261-1884(+)